MNSNYLLKDKCLISWVSCKLIKLLHMLFSVLEHMYIQVLYKTKNVTNKLTAHEQHDKYLKNCRLRIPGKIHNFLFYPVCSI